MLDPNLLRKDLSYVLARLLTRKNPQPYLDTAVFESLEDERKTIQVKTEVLQAKRNSVSKIIGIAKSKKESVDAEMAEMASIKEELAHCENRLSALQEKLHAILLNVPNLPHESVPVGQDESHNVEIKRWSPFPDNLPTSFAFPVKDHVELSIAFGGDFEMGAKLTCARFTVLKGQSARLHRALAQFMLHVQTTEHGYIECYVPYIMNADSLKGTGQLPKFEEDLFAAKKGGQDASESSTSHALYLIPTSEVPLTNFVRDTVVAEAELPIKLTAHTPCFRSEAGSAGRDTRGFIRQHQFDKVEMVQIVHPEKSYDTLTEMVGHAERILQLLELPYRVISLSTGEMGFGSAKTFDLEVWLPGQNTYREISSVSNCEAFQARRLQARFKNAQGKNELLHTLNGSGLAIGRTLAALLENHQQSDGSLKIPKALQPFMDGEEILKPAA